MEEPHCVFLETSITVKEEFIPEFASSNDKLFPEEEFMTRNSQCEQRLNRVFGTSFIWHLSNKYVELLNAVAYVNH